MKTTDLTSISHDVLALLRSLIALQTFSREEGPAAEAILAFLYERGIPAERYGNNVYTCNRYFDPSLPTVLLNSHTDTVRPNKDWTRSPFSPDIEDGKLYGLGSNDAGGALCSLAGAFIALYEEENLGFNIVFAATAEEEINGENGIAALIPLLGKIDCAIVGEPTEMKAAIAEKGLLVLDCEARGASGHAARDIGTNAIYKAMDDIRWFQTFQFPKISPTLGPVKMTVTQIEAGSQHNVIPDRCRFVVDIRVTDAYTHEEIVSTISSSIESEILPRSMRLRPSSIAHTHPLVQAANALDIETFGSPTMSDQALLSMPSIKMGPGRSERSHTADEFIYVDEILTGVEKYYTFLRALSHYI